MNSKRPCDMCDLISAYKTGGEAAVRNRVSASPAMRTETSSASVSADVMRARGVTAESMHQARGAMFFGTTSPAQDSKYQSSRAGDRISSREMRAGMSQATLASMLFRDAHVEESRTGFVTSDRAASATTSMTAYSPQFIPF